MMPISLRAPAPRPMRLADSGLVTVLSQTFRALIHSRMRVGMERYATEFPDADVVLFEPAQDDAVMFFANMFSYADRRRLAEHAYRHTLAELQAPRRMSSSRCSPATALNSTAPFLKDAEADAGRSLVKQAVYGIACSRWTGRWTNSKKR